MKAVTDEDLERKIIEAARALKIASDNFSKPGGMDVMESAVMEVALAVAALQEVEGE